MKKALVTGSSRGIGEAIARRLLSDGYEVVIHGKSDSRELKKLAEELAVEKIVFDLGNPDDISDKVAGLGHLNLLVNSAGINISKPFDDLTENDWLDVFNTNFFGLVHLCKCIKANLYGDSSNIHSRIINLSSIKGFNCSVGRLAYASSKAALNLFTAGLAKEFAPNVLVNAVAPGFTHTEMTESTWTPRIEAQVKKILLQRMASPEEIAGVVSFLASPDASYITGQTIIVDGGFTIND